MTYSPMNNLRQPLLNQYEVVNKIVDEVVNDYTIIQRDETDETYETDETHTPYSGMITINYSDYIPIGTVIHYMKKNKRYCGRVLDDRKYAPRKEFNQEGYVHLTMIQFDNGKTDDLYYQIFQSECIVMKDYNCIILNPLTES